MDTKTEKRELLFAGDQALSGAGKDMTGEKI